MRLSLIAGRKKLSSHGSLLGAFCEHQLQCPGCALDMQCHVTDQEGECCLVGLAFIQSTTGTGLLNTFPSSQDERRKHLSSSLGLTLRYKRPGREYSWRKATEPRA